VSLWFIPSAFAAEPPSYAKDIKPFLSKYCLECHNGPKGKAELDVSTYPGFLKGGISFPGFVPGKPNESFAVTLVEGKSKPVMPPKNKPQPTAEEKKLLRDWVGAGAKDDSTGTKVTLPEIKSRARPAAAIAALAYRPDGKLLAVGGYQEARLVDPGKGSALGRLPEQKASVTALAFSHDGQRLAVASGSTGEAGEIRVYGSVNGQINSKPDKTFTAHADIIHAVDFSPDGAILATTGYDRLIKLWDVSSGKELRILKDHSDAVYGLAFSPDGKLLASAAADRAVKVWEAASGKRLYTLADNTDWAYAVAWSPDGKRLAAGGVDRSVRVWEANAEGGKLVQSAFAHEGPILRLVYASDGKTLYSLSEDRSVKAWETAKLTEKKVYDKQAEAVLSLAVSPDHKQIALGRFDGALVLLDEATGKVQAQPLPATAKLPGDRFDPVDKKPGNDTPARSQQITLPVTIVGSIDRAGAVDFYRFEAKAGQQLGVQVMPGDAAKLEPMVQLTDAAGSILAEGGTVLGHSCKQAGSYILSIRDRDYRGGGLAYRLNVGEIPIVTAVFPPGLQRGSDAEIKLEGVHLGTAAVRMKVAAHATVGSRLPLPLQPPLGAALGVTSVVVGEFPEVTQDGTADSNSPTAISVPGTANGRIARTNGEDVWRFSAKKGQRLIIEVNARRIGSPLDSFIEILDGNNQPVPRAVIRCLAKTYTTLRDHDSNTPGIRLEAWNEFATNDYVWIGNELLRIKALPKNPDDDCQFLAVNGQRAGQLDTTPTFQVLASTMYKVSIHPPGTTFPPNGFPVILLNYRNDDGGPGYGKDSRLFFDPPADGEYRVRIGDARGQAGSAYVYRLTVRPPRPSFQVRFNPTAPAVWRGGALPITVTADRFDGYDDAIDVRMENLPPGFSAPPTTIPAGETITSFALFAEPTAPLPEKAAELKLVTRAKINGQEFVREAAGGKPQLVEPGDIITTTEKNEVTVKPGQSVKLTVQIERRNKFAGRVPLEVRGLPHGVRVLDIGLNGILITEKDSSRTMEIYCEPWVQPTEHPFVVLAKREGKGSEHAAKSVLLKVSK
jgi:dipeptidyl aminopeptidase/acylaminoacyl peptidase